jgi:hypothetical protein
MFPPVNGSVDWVERSRRKEQPGDGEGNGCDEQPWDGLTETLARHGVLDQQLNRASGVAGADRPAR